MYSPILRNSGDLKTGVSVPPVARSSKSMKNKSLPAATAQYIGPSSQPAVGTIIGDKPVIGGQKFADQRGFAFGVVQESQGAAGDV